jgi:hypothetical protein
MKRSYSHFKIEDIRELGIEVSRQKLFATVENLYPSEWLLQTLAINQQIPAESEKAKSELLISPILNELFIKNPKQFTYFSGYQFNVDQKLGLKGFCDFIISRKYNAAFIESPLVAIVEAKQNQDLVDAAPQCIAEMYAATIFNQRENSSVSTIFGIVTNGYEWLFLTLENLQVIIDTERYGLKNLPELLGVWQIIIDRFQTII